jgi:hypothetical protein
MEENMGKNPLKRSLIVGIVFLFLSTTCLPVLAYKEYIPSKIVSEMSDDDFEFVGIDHISKANFQPAPAWFDATIWILVKNNGTTKTTYWMTGGMSRIMVPYKYVGQVDYIDHPDPWYHGEIRVIPSITYFGQDALFPGIFRIIVKIKGINTNQYDFYLLWSGYYFLYGGEYKFPILQTFP